MIKFIPYVLKTLWRHRSRTILTVTGSAVAIFVFCFVGAVQEGMNDLQTRQESEGTLISFQKNKFCPATSHLPQDYSGKIRKMTGVKDVVPVQVFTNNCRASLDSRHGICYRLLLCELQKSPVFNLFKKTASTT